MPRIRANRTKVGLKRSFRTLKQNFPRGANRTKVGLKLHSARLEKLEQQGANRTKVGLKLHNTLYTYHRQSVLIEPRWD